MENVMNYLKPQQDKYSDEWERDLEEPAKIKMLAKLDMLEDLSNYIDCLREGYTRTLKLNNVSDEEPVENVSGVVKIIDTSESDTSISPSPCHASP